jgi:shikimate kinase
MKLLVLYGAPAAGKLTVARELAALTGYKLLDNHKATDYIADLFPRTDPAVTKIRSALGRRVRLDIFGAAAQAGINMITTFAPLSPGTQQFLRDIRRTVTEHGGEALFVHLAPSQDVLLARVTSESRRGRKIDTVERWHKVVDSGDNVFETFPDMPHLVLDNSDLSPQEAARQILAYYPQLQ